MGIIEFIKDKFGVNKETNKEELNLTKRILKEEKKFFAEQKDATYDFFGYFGMKENELPFFERIKEKSSLEDGTPFKVGEMVYAYTPAILKHCVTHLTDEWKQIETEDIAGFEKKCKELSNAAAYMNGNWDSTITELVDYLQYDMSFNIDPVDTSIDSEEAEM